jgi:hypothetical protein
VLGPEANGGSHDLFDDSFTTPLVVGRIASDQRKIDAMHMLIFNFQLNGLDEAEYRQACEEKAPAFASGPGLLSEIRLADRSTNTNGGVYIGGNRQAKQIVVGSDRFRRIADPRLKNVTPRDFDVLSTPTEATPGTTRARA